MPRSPAEGASTRGPADLDVSAQLPSRDRRVRSGPDRRHEDVGPPNGIERRRYERRSHDRRSHARVDRRRSERRTSSSRRGTGSGAGSGPRHLTRTPAPKVHLAPVVAKRSRTAKTLRAAVITLVALACLLAATLTELPESGAAIQVLPALLP